MTARRKQGGTYTAEQLAYIRSRAGKDPDAKIGLHLGFAPRKVAYIRHDNGIRGGTAGRNTRSEAYQAKLAYVKAHYVDLGETSTEVAAALGTTPKDVRRIAHREGWERPRSFRDANQVKGQLRRHAERRAAEQAAIAAKPAPVKIVRTDAELIAVALAAGKVTLLPPGQACGLTSWEANLGTYKPSPVYGWGQGRTAEKSEEQRRRAGARGRRVVELTRPPSEQRLARLEAAE